MSTRRALLATVGAIYFALAAPASAADPAIVGVPLLEAGNVAQNGPTSMGPTLPDAIVRPVAPMRLLQGSGPIMFYRLPTQPLPGCGPTNC